MPTESVFLRKGNREKLRKAEEKTGLSLARLINILVEEGHLDELVNYTERPTSGLRTNEPPLPNVICSARGFVRLIAD